MTTAHPSKRRKVAMIGTGQVGMAIAYPLLIEGSVNDLVLVDAAHEKAEGEVMDLMHGLSFVSPTYVHAGSLEDCAQADVIVITAGAKRRVGEARLDLMQRNVGIFQEIIPTLLRVAPDAVFVVVSNPVDVMSYVTWKLAQLPSSKIIGSGTLLDTARFRYLLSERLDIDARHVHAYILGEHGDSEVPIWSRANVSGIPLDRAMGKNFSPETLQQIADDVKHAAQEVIRRKGATCYAIGLGVTRLVQAILSDQKRVMTVSCLMEGAYGLRDVYLSLPAVVGRAGILRILEPELSPTETAQLQHSASILQDALRQIGFLS